MTDDPTRPTGARPQGEPSPPQGEPSPPQGEPSPPQGELSPARAGPTSAPAYPAVDAGSWRVRERGAATDLELHARALAAENARGREFLAELAHELRNPLAPLNNSLELLRRADFPAASRERALEVMARQLRHLSASIDALDRAAHSAAPGPPAEPARAGNAAAAPAASPAGPQRVLIADDNALIRQSMVQLLGSEGYSVRTACDGIEAIELCAQWRPQLVILDAYMPRLSGIEAARRLRERHPRESMTLLLMSGMALSEAWIGHAREAGFDDCLDKGAAPAEWLARLRNHAPRLP
jgi:CheY-like chemotaxis protein